MRVLSKLIDYVAYRTTKRFHVLKMYSLTPGYWDKDEILLHAVMQLVVDFVEIECAFMELDAPFTFKQKLYLKYLPWFLRSDNLIRNRDAGLRHLNHLADFYNDKLAGSTIAPLVIRDVYLWWKDIRPLRPTPEDASGWSAFYQERDPAVSKDLAKAERILKKLTKIENQYQAEDTKMLKKIIESRDFMWT